MATLNIGMKVNRAITGATTVNANAYAMVNYRATSNSSTNGSADGSTYQWVPELTKYFGPGQSIPASFSVQIGVAIETSSNTGTSSVTYSISSGVELINTQ
jgi:hypothetical protein